MFDSLPACNVNTREASLPASPVKNTPEAHCGGARRNMSADDVQACRLIVCTAAATKS